jgi:lipopolysaccharide cholinephosphotransferase
MPKYLINGKKYKYDADLSVLKGKGPLNKEIARSNLFDLIEIFDKHNIKYFLAYGTLLGAVRGGDFIDHDKDMDIGVVDCTYKDIIQCIPDMDTIGFVVLRSRNIFHPFSVIRNGEFIDIFIFKPNNKKHPAYWVAGDYRIYGNYLEKITTIKFFGRDVNVPHNYEKMLEDLYGRDWKVPIRDCPAPIYYSPTVKLRIYFKRILPASFIAVVKKMMPGGKIFRS